MSVLHMAAALLIAVIFGLNYSVIKLGLGAFDPLLLAGLRFSLCAFPALCFVSRPRCQPRYVVVYGLAMSLGLWSVLLALRAGLSAGICALVLQFGALLTVCVGVLRFGERLTRANFLGFTLAAAGLVMILFVTDGSVTAMGMAYAVLGTGCWVMANTAVKMSATTQPFAFVIWSGPVSAGLIFALRVVLTGKQPLAGLLQDLHAQSIAALLFTAYVESLLAYGIWSLLLSRYHLAVSAPIYLLAPLFSMLFSHWIFGEPVGSLKAMAAVCIASGVSVNACGSVLYERWLSRRSGRRMSDMPGL